MSNSRVQNILFDRGIDLGAPVDLGNNNLVRSIDTIYNGKTFKLCLEVYMGLLLIQYLLIYASVPFDNIDNRPALLIVTCLYCLFMVSEMFLYFQDLFINDQLEFSINACLLPICSTAVPTMVSFRCLIVSSFFEFIGFLLNTSSVVAVMTCGPMFLYEYDEETRADKKADVTTYVRAVIISSFVANAFTWIVSMFNVVLTSQALKRLFNRIDRIDNHHQKESDFANHLPKQVLVEQKRFFIP